MNSLALHPVNTNVFSVHTSDGQHVGNLKRVGAVWKFKAVGYEDDGAVVPGGGPLTDRHNATFDSPDTATLNAVLGAA